MRRMRRWDGLPPASSARPSSVYRDDGCGCDGLVQREPTLSPSDKEVVRRVRAGFKDDFAVLVARYHLPLARYIISRSHDRTAADDLVQQTFVSAYRQLATYDDARPFLDWLRGIALNHCRNEWRRQMRQARLLEQKLDSWRAEQEAAAIDLNATDDRLPALRQCLESLGDDERKLITMRFHERQSLRAIGDMLGRTDEAVRQLLYRIRGRLANCVRRRLAAGEEKRSD